MLLNSAQDPQYYQWNFRIWEGVFSDDVMNLTLTFADEIDGELVKTGNTDQFSFIR